MLQQLIRDLVSAEMGLTGVEGTLGEIAFQRERRAMFYVHVLVPFVLARTPTAPQPLFAYRLSCERRREYRVARKTSDPPKEATVISSPTPIAQL